MGDKIKVLSRVNAEWVNGELCGKSGIFPVEFVDSVPENLLSEAPKKEEASKEPKAKVHNNVNVCMYRVSRGGGRKFKDDFAL